MGAVLEAIAKAKNAISIEVVPPSRGGDRDDILLNMQKLLPYAPGFVSVTDHPAGRAWVERDGGPVAVPVRGKPGTLGLCVAIREACALPVVPHLVCVGNDRFRAEDELIDISYAGFRDVFVVRGDERFAPFAVRGDESFAARGQEKGAPPRPERSSVPRASDMIALVRDMNSGVYSGGQVTGKGTLLSIGVAGYPEKHPESLNPERDIACLKAKVDAGAEWIVTQMVFDARTYGSYVARARAAGITIPILPGIKPLTRLASLYAVPGAFHVDVPCELAEALEGARTPAEERKAGIAHAAGLMAELYDAGAPCVHLFTMGKARDAAELCDAVFGSATAQRNYHAEPA